MLTIEQVSEIIIKGVSDRVQMAREQADRVNMHITGKDAKEHIEKLENYENQKQKDLREKLFKSNKSLFSFLLRPIDKVFTAKGGSITYNLQENQISSLQEATDDISGGLDIKDYLKKKGKAKYIIDANGFVMVDVSEEGELETKIYSTNDIIWYDTRGNTVKAIVFNPFENEDKDDTKKYYRVIDELTDSIYIQDGENIYLDEDNVYENFFGYVPAYILGDLYDPNTDLFLSVIDDVLEDAEERLRDVSVNTVHKLSHGYAKYWQYPEACTKCGGSGELKVKDTLDAVVEVVCDSCQGSGVKSHKDASDLMLIDIPNAEEQKITPDVGGYINPSIEIWKQYLEEADRIKNEMFQTLWGTTYTTEGKNETATGKFLDAQPVQDRLGSISLTFSKIHKFIIDCYGQAVLNKTEYECSVSYGDRYIIETPDEALKRFAEANRDDLPEVLQTDLLDKFYQTEYATNNLEYSKKKKILAVDPFPFLTASEVKELGVDEKDLKAKIYYPQWVNQLTDAKEMLMTEEELKLDLEKYVENKLLIKIENHVVQQRTA